MRRVLITGGAGFIGSNFTRHWHTNHREDQIVVLDALTYAGNLANISDIVGSNCAFVHASLSDKNTLRKTLHDHSIDTVVHFAAESHVDRSITGPDAFIETNIVGTHNLLSECRGYWLDKDTKGHHFHHVSTDEVFGMLLPGDPAFTEITPYSPNSPYSASKAAADHLVRAYHHTYGLKITISNCSNNYGPYHFPEKLIPLAIVNLLTGKQIPIYGEGLNVRDWLHVSDHCVAIDEIIQRGGVGETYNVGGNCERTNREVVQTICDSVDRAFADDPSLTSRFPNSAAARGQRSVESIVMVPDRPGHDFRYAIDATKIENELGFRCSVPFEEGIRDTVNWFLSNERWWLSVMDGSYRDYMEKAYGSLSG